MLWFKAPGHTVQVLFGIRTTVPARPWLTWSTWTPTSARLLMRSAMLARRGGRGPSDAEKLRLCSAAQKYVKVGHKGQAQGPGTAEGQGTARGASNKDSSGQARREVTCQTELEHLPQPLSPIHHHPLNAPHSQTCSQSGTHGAWPPSPTPPLVPGRHWCRTPEAAAAGCRRPLPQIPLRQRAWLWMLRPAVVVWVLAVLRLQQAVLPTPAAAAAPLLK